MINPACITNFHRTNTELEEFAIFSILVAGKNAKVTARQLDQFMQYNVKKRMPTKYILNFGIAHLPNALQIARIGCYNQKANTLLNFSYEVLYNKLNLRTCSTEELEKIKGIGPKTSRFFILHSRANARLAVLDTHILKGLRDNGVENVPRETPKTTKQYNRLEQCFLYLADKAEKSPAELDLGWWKYYSGN